MLAAIFGILKVPSMRLDLVHPAAERVVLVLERSVPARFA
jgi:hypothetical protein